MTRLLAAIVLLLGCASLALAQSRALPAEAKRGVVRHVQGMLVTIDGVAHRLSPGARIRDQSNRLMLPISLPADSTVKYKIDAQGMVHEVWILTPEESASESPSPRGPSKD